MTFKEHGPVEQAAGGGDGGVEALKVSGLDEASVLRCERDQLVSFGKRGGERLLDEQIQSATGAGGQQRARGGEMMHGGHADAGGIDRETGVEKLFNRGEVRDAVLDTGGLPGGGVGVDDGDQFGLRQLAVDTQVIAAEGSGAHDGYARWAPFCHYLPAGFSTASRQRA